MKKFTSSIVIIVIIIMINCFFNVTYSKSNNTSNLSKTSEYVFPLDTKKIQITKNFTKEKPYITIAAPTSTIVYAMKEGKVVARTLETIAIQNKEYIYIYKNTNTFSKQCTSPLIKDLKIGDKVSKGQPIGRVGYNGFIGLGLKIKSKEVDPLKYISFDGNLDINIKECNSTNNDLTIKSNKDVNFKLSTKSNYKIQISYDKTANWKDYKNNLIKIKTNDYIFTRLVDNDNNVVKMKCFIIQIDNKKPTNTAPQLVTKTTNRITASLAQFDLNLDYNKNYIAIRDTSSKNNKWSKWIKFSQEKTFYNLKPNTKYEIVTKVSDKFNNTTKSKKLTVITDKRTPNVKLATNIDLEDGNLYIDDSMLSTNGELYIYKNNGYKIEINFQDPKKQNAWQIRKNITFNKAINNRDFYIRFTDGTNGGKYIKFRVNKDMWVKKITIF